jgi:hypothetical protein
VSGWKSVESVVFVSAIWLIFDEPSDWLFATTTVTGRSSRAAVSRSATW